MAYRQALEVRTRATLPQDWAAPEQPGRFLQTPGERTAGEAGTAPPAEAVAAQAWASGSSPRHAPKGWATTQTNLGILPKAERTAGEGARPSWPRP